MNDVHEWLRENPSDVIAFPGRERMISSEITRWNTIIDRAGDPLAIASGAR
jgi:hypothetical protein